MGLSDLESSRDGSTRIITIAERTGEPSEEASRREVLFLSLGRLVLSVKSQGCELGMCVQLCTTGQREERTNRPCFIATLPSSSASI